MSSGSTDGAQSRNTVDCGGSSTTFSRALAAPSVSRSASSTTTICQRPVPGRREAICTISRISLTAIDSPSGMIRRTSACVPAIVVVHARHSPQPGTPSEVHCRAAAKHTAATERPDPGGPVINQAWVIPPAVSALCEPAARAAKAAATSSSSTWC
ncbi:hypothetical protein BN1047_05156 [Mycolicibacterium neoaurum]|uniref:Uncharacterized protein n=1 Tax=Mycolicibacterium neoaurum TaxID=1795 RepID=A0AAV2WUI5_MYCNE|nr:hypothetical protein BN1047_05156 [Mycolicibacterium neoaurum]